LIANGIDSYTAGQFVYSTTSIIFAIVSVLIFVLLYLQSILQVYLSEKVAKDLRTELIAKISVQNYDSIQKIGSSKLLTYITSDVDAVKNFVSLGLSSVISSVFLII
jgi:ATP-binding cassette subfamily B protein